MASTTILRIRQQGAAPLAVTVATVVAMAVTAAPETSTAVAALAQEWVVVVARLVACATTQTTVRLARTTPRRNNRDLREEGETQQMKVNLKQSTAVIPKSASSINSRTTGAGSLLSKCSSLLG